MRDTPLHIDVDVEADVCFFIACLIEGLWEEAAAVRHSLASGLMVAKGHGSPPPTCTATELRFWLVG